MKIFNYGNDYAQGMKFNNKDNAATTAKQVVDKAGEEVTSEPEVTQEEGTGGKSESPKEGFKRKGKKEKASLRESPEKE